MGFYGPVGWSELVYVPMTGWSKRNPYFDGLKYCGGSIAQNPYNVLNIGIDNFMEEEGEEIPEEFKREKPAERSLPKFLLGPRWIEY
jgi:hypothetical protein